jgi:drug/metabolite transporter (DMT)-like permease
MTQGLGGRDRLLLGAGCVVGAGLMFALAGMSIKMASGNLSNGSIVFWRNAISLAILTPWALWYRQTWLRPGNLRLIAFRAVAVLASLYCYYYAIAAIPLADAVLLNFCSPIFVPLLGLLLFRFPLDRTVLVAVAIGFLGVALVLKPGIDIVDPAALVGLMGGALGGLAVVVLWRMPASENPVRIAFFFAVIGTVLSAIPNLVLREWPGIDDWLPLAMLGAFSTMAHLLLAYGCLVAPADRVITLDYTTVVFAALIGWMIWGEQPDLLMALGAGLIIYAGIHITRSRRRPRPPRGCAPTSAPTSASPPSPPSLPKAPRPARLFSASPSATGDAPRP